MDVPIATIYWAPISYSRGHCLGPLPTLTPKLGPLPAFKKKKIQWANYIVTCGFPEDLRCQGVESQGTHSISPKISIRHGSFPGPLLLAASLCLPPLGPSWVCPTFRLFLLLPFLPPAAINLDRRLESHLHPTVDMIFAWKPSTSHSGHSDTMCAMLSLRSYHPNLTMRDV